MALAFVDDSGSGGDSPYYILAGYSARESTWQAFWPRWQSVLDAMPKLEYFKMREAESLKGQFLGFSADQRDHRLNMFIDVVLMHDLQEASIAVPHKLYREILYPVLPATHANPYYFAFIAMVAAFAGINRHSGSLKSVDFIFDEQRGMQNRALRLYHRLEVHFPHWQFGRVAYGADETMLPLQAADLIAWQIRRFKSSAEPVRGELRRLHSGSLPPYKKTLNRSTMEGMVKAMNRNLPSLRAEHGDNLVENFLMGIEKRNRREGIG
jgi:hypothetical protein